MMKSPGVAGAMRHMPRCLSLVLSAVVALVAPISASARRPEHSTHVHRASQEEKGRPDFSRVATRARKKRAPGASARGAEHPTGEGSHKSEAAPSSQAHHKSSSRRHRQIEPDFDPITMKRAAARRSAPRRATSGHQVAGRERSTEPSTERKALSEVAATDPHSLKTDDFLRAARGEDDAPESAAGRTRRSSAVPFATGVAHPPSTPVRVSAAPAASSYIDERQVAETQRVAIGDALRPQQAPEEAVGMESASASPATPRLATSSMSSSLPASAPTGTSYAPEPTVSTQLASVSAPPSERSYVAARSVVGDDIANRAPEDAVRSTALGQLSHQEMASAAVAPSLPGLYSRDGHIIVPAPLKGSHEVLVHQNEMADAAGLTRIRNDRELDQLRREHRLIDFEDTDGLRINPELPERRRCARPWTVAFAVQMARAYYAEFREPFTVSSAVRTMAFQARLQRVNGNAAATRGEAASPHLTGQAFDIGKSGMTLAEIAWLRTYLAPMIESGRIDVEEEFQQACFHISVYPMAATHRRTQIAEVR